MTESKHTQALANKIATVLNEAKISVPPGAKIVLIVQCREPEAGEDMVAESVVRLGCDPCGAAQLMAMCIALHNEQEHPDEGDDPPAHGILQ